MSTATDEPPGAAEWVGLALICASSAASALLELMYLSALYAGSVIVPVTVVVAIAGNLVLPRWGMSVVGTLRGAVLPFAAWLVVTLVPALYHRPEGDQFVLGSFGQNYAYYALLLGGAITGFATIVVAGGRPPR
ncbi:MAG: hypothetical protein ACRDVG_11910 [Jatrophihabitantaceae bacterium]